MIGQVYINGKDAHTEWGISLTDTALSTLMTPPPMKEFVENKSRVAHGKLVAVSNPKVDERTISISFNILAASRDDLNTKYASFCQELKTGSLDITTKYQQGVVYHFIYVSCTQFSQWNGQIGKFTLKLNEPNPNNRV